MDPHRRKQKDHGSKFKAVVTKSVVIGGCTLIGQYVMDVIEINVLGRAYVDLKISVGQFQLQGIRRT